MPCRVETQQLSRGEEGGPERLRPVPGRRVGPPRARVSGQGAGPTASGAGGAPSLLVPRPTTSRNGPPGAPGGPRPPARPRSRGSPAGGGAASSPASAPAPRAVEEAPEPGPVGGRDPRPLQERGAGAGSRSRSARAWSPGRSPAGAAARWWPRHGRGAGPTAGRPVRRPPPRRSRQGGRHDHPPWAPAGEDGIASSARPLRTGTPEPSQVRRRTSPVPGSSATIHASACTSVAGARRTPATQSRPRVEERCPVEPHPLAQPARPRPSRPTLTRRRAPPRPR